MSHGERIECGCVVDAPRCCGGDTWCSAGKLPGSAAIGTPSGSGAYSVSPMTTASGVDSLRGGLCAQRHSGEPRTWRWAALLEFRCKSMTIMLWNNALPRQSPRGSVAVAVAAALGGARALSYYSAHLWWHHGFPRMGCVGQGKHTSGARAPS